MKWSILVALLAVTVGVGCVETTRSLKRLPPRQRRRLTEGLPGQMPTLRAFPDSEGENKKPVVTAANIVNGMDPSNMRYDLTTEMTFRGTILGFVRVPLAGDRKGLFVRLSVGGEVPYIYLGPEDWLFLHDIDPRLQNPIMATGSRIVLSNQTVFLARKIVLNGIEYELRDQGGNPRWPEPTISERAADQTVAERQPSTQR